MTKIDELMVMIANEVAAAEYGAFDRIRKALEAALKPGDKAQQIAECVAAIKPVVRGKFPAEQALDELVGYTASPAQTGEVTEERGGGLPWTVKCSDGKTRVLWPHPPSQTPVPPRLTNKELLDVAVNGDEWFTVYRSIETAVRKQFGVNDE